MNVDRLYMQRAISLARNGLGAVSPNPMVGAVIVHDDRIIGEGWHRRYGEAHAEVNAVAAVSDKSLLSQSTIYVTLEPCSHYGKTPPCSKLLIENNLARVVVGSLDPFAKVSGRGVGMLRDAGIDVEVGVLEHECKAVNPFFMKAHSTGRPWVTLKWAQSRDGFIDRIRSVDEAPSILSSPLTSMLTHRLRSLHDAILVGSNTMLTDRPSLTVRHWPGKSPRRFVADRSGKIALPDGFTRAHGDNPIEMLEYLYSEGVTSVLVEGGTRLLQSFIDAGVADMIRVETATNIVLSDGVRAPYLPVAVVSRSMMLGESRLDYYGDIPWFIDNV